MPPPCFLPDLNAWAFPGSAASWPRPLYPLELCTLPINSTNNCSWFWGGGVAGWRCILQLSDSAASLTSGELHLLRCGREPALTQQQSKYSHGQCEAAPVQAGTGPVKALGFLIMVFAWTFASWIMLLRDDLGLCSPVKDLGWAAACLLVPARSEEVPANTLICFEAG